MFDYPSLIRSTLGTTLPNSPFLKLPYTTREDIYAILLDWISSELMLYVNPSLTCEDPRSAYQDSIAAICVARSPRAESEKRANWDLTAS